MLPDLGKETALLGGRCELTRTAGTLQLMTKTLIRVTTAAGAMLVGAASFLVLDLLAGIDLAARTGSTVQHVTLSAVVVAAAVSAAAGWTSLALLERFATRGRAVWTGVAIAVVLLSLLLGPAAGTSTAAKGGLALLHLAVGAAVIGGMRWSSRVTTTAPAGDGPVG